MKGWEIKIRTILEKKRDKGDTSKSITRGMNYTQGMGEAPLFPQILGAYDIVLSSYLLKTLFVCSSYLVEDTFRLKWGPQKI